MDKTYPPEAWQHLGKVLERRRGQLGYGFRQREAFLHDRGGPPPSAKMLARLERGERTTYPDSTVTLLESMYGYEPGSFEVILGGGEGIPVPGKGGPALRAVPAHPAHDGGDDSESAAEDELVRLLAENPGDPILAKIAIRGGAKATTRLREAKGWLGVQADIQRNGTNG